MADSEDGDAIIVKADEVDEAGADISAISPTDATESEFTERIESRRAFDAQSSGSPKILANAAPSPPRLQPLSRPILRREGSIPAPPQQPPPPLPEQKQEEPQNPTDSLSLTQLKRLVADLPKIEPTAYAYDYTETLSFPEELQEWFQYSEQDTLALLKAKHTFIQTWEQVHSERPEPSDAALEWPDVEDDDRTWFVECAIRALDHSAPNSRIKSLECLSYIALGVWGDTAGLPCDRSIYEKLIGHLPSFFEFQDEKSKLQLCWIIAGARLLLEHGIIARLIGILQSMWKSEQYTDVDDQPSSDHSRLRQLELDNTLTILYVVIEVCRWQTSLNTTIEPTSSIPSQDLQELSVIILRMIAKYRWDEQPDTTSSSRQKLFLLFWKLSLLSFGNFGELENSKRVLSPESFPEEAFDKDQLMTASPLDYHLFRQEITSKYPAYDPPPPLLPIELENSSLLPPLPNHPSRQASQDALHDIMGNGQTMNESILNQAVHIATPAPSPPPSPAGPGGKGGKKQNYQTNQNFPFLYPSVGDQGEGAKPVLNGDLPPSIRAVKKQWEDNDVPASILEAGQLFASRMRMSRSMRQIWDVRESFIQAERGWNGARADEDHDHEENDNEDNEEDVHIKGEENWSDTNKSKAAATTAADLHELCENEDVQQRLNAVNDFYRRALPDLQSFVIVLFKELFQNVQALILQNGPNGAPNGAAEDAIVDAQGRRKTNPNSSASLNAMANGQLADGEEPSAPAVEGLNEIRSREISSKAVSGILLVLLKWFRLSHIMKFEYLTQLLLDANFLPLVLKYFAHQDIDKAVEQRYDREDLNLFAFCRMNSKNPVSVSPQPALSSSNSSSEDEAAPPPISRHRRSPTYRSQPPTPPPPHARPEVDELGFPTTGNLPQTPLTNYAPRFFLININLLRLLQKITKRKAHRALLLVQYKSSTILRKALKIPQSELRLYTLKLFKSQVPYCGRKWRQTNMRVITAIYLHCRPSLRDEWLCGGDVDGVVEEALPLEQAGRSLVHWWHLEHFRDVMEGGTGTTHPQDKDQSRNRSGDGSEEYDFFARELDKLGWGFGGTALGGGAGVEDDEGYVEGIVAERTEFEGGPLQMEGWA